MVLYAKEYWWSIGGFIGVLAILNIVGRLSAWLELRASSLSDAETARVPSQHRSSSLLARLWGALISLVSIVLFRLPFPLRSLHRINTVAEFACVGSYMGATIAWTLMSTDASVVKVSDIARVMAAVQVPFIIALAGKNNVITWLTGLSHERLNVIHRAAGRACFAISWLHGGAMLYLRHNTIFHRWGMVALAGLSAAAIFSVRPVRNFSYELFLMGHILFIIMFITGLLLHEPLYRRYSYPGLVFWAFDRLLRLARMAWINLTLTSPKESHHSSSVELLSTDTVRVSLTRPRKTLASWRAGQHFFIIAPGIANLPWEAHPFTSSTIPHSLGGTDEDDVHVEFIIRGRDGFTGNLLEHAILNGAAPKIAKAETFILDGPYGQPPNLGVFDTAILVAGGSGVSYTLSMLLDRIYRAQSGRDRTSRVLFIWAVRQESHLNWIAPALQKALHAPALTNAVGEVDEKLKGSPISATSSKTDWSPSQSHTQLVELVEGGGGRVRVLHSRPDMQTVIDEELAASEGLKVSVDVSGPGKLVEAVKHTLATSSFSSPAAVLRGGPSVTLHSEVFGW
ncbi:hypothetical protein DL93DRAFT_2062937 [Clavulina sp. PMI_390]|nr:hypothetical protein DL93DRAFT_2062937 [Clavulina sp. PMI_390]